MESNKPRLVKEVVGGEPYEYYPLGEYVVVAPGVCGGRPTFKYTRLEVSMVLARLAQGDSPEILVKNYESSHLSTDAIAEAIELANQAFVETTRPLSLAA
ncbi:MAG: DUF433 domain-containing protein [Anaerolineae bacterium]|nr:DUF433 domain-containing protein [Anaerolineae bacterium]